MSKPYISYVDPAKVTDKAMLAEFDRCAREGTPRPESQAIRAHVPAVFWAFANSWRDVFKNGVADHDLKELCRVYVSRSVKCEFCGNQRSMKAASRGLAEDDSWLRPRGASGLGVVALMRGQPRTATRYFRITVASLNEFDYLFLRYNLSYLARGAALAGESPIFLVQ